MTICLASKTWDTNCGQWQTWSRRAFLCSLPWDGLGFHFIWKKYVTFANHVTFTSSLVKDILGIMYHYRQRIKPCSHKTLVKTMVKWLKEGWQKQEATREFSIGRLWWRKWRASRNSGSKLTCLLIPNPMIYQRISCGNNQKYMLKLLLPPLSSSLRFILTMKIVLSVC